MKDLSPKGLKKVVVDFSEKGNIVITGNSIFYNVKFPISLQDEKYYENLQYILFRRNYFKQGI